MRDLDCWVVGGKVGEVSKGEMSSGEGRFVCLKKILYLWELVCYGFLWTSLV